VRDEEYGCVHWSPRLYPLPASQGELMWRVARTSMEMEDWDTALAALGTLVTAPGKLWAGRRGFGKEHFFSKPPCRQGRGPGPGGEVLRQLRNGPGMLRVTRALAFCQLKRGLHRKALETTAAGLDLEAGAGAGGQELVGDPALLMYRADALLCLEEGEAEASNCLRKATESLQRRRIKLSSGNGYSYSYSSRATHTRHHSTPNYGSSVEVNCGSGGGSRGGGDSGDGDDDDTSGDGNNPHLVPKRQKKNSHRSYYSVAGLGG
ncbi:unnamed protein product, partial [Discosporangium mesarthrocarpum]